MQRRTFLKSCIVALSGGATAIAVTESSIFPQAPVQAIEWFGVENIGSPDQRVTQWCGICKAWVPLKWYHFHSDSLIINMVSHHY